MQTRLALLLAVTFLKSAVCANLGRIGLNNDIQDELAMEWPTSGQRTTYTSKENVEETEVILNSEIDLIEEANEEYMNTPVSPGPLSVSNAGQSTSADEVTVIKPNSYVAEHTGAVDSGGRPKSEGKTDNEEQGQGHAGSKGPVAAGSTNYETSSNVTRSPKANAVKLALGDGLGMVILRIADTITNTTSDVPLPPSLSIDYQYSSDTVIIYTNHELYSSASLDPIVDKGLDGPVRLAVDWINSRLYWLSYHHQTLESANLDGTNRTILIRSRTKFSYPDNIAVDPFERALFFVSNHSVYRSDLEGRHLERILEPAKTNRRVRCLALDVSKKRLYITGKLENNSTNSYISSSDYRGLALTDYSLGNKTWNDIFTFDVLGNTIYMAEFSLSNVDTIWTLDISQMGSSPTKLYQVPTERKGLYVLRVYHASVQPKIESQDSNTTPPTR